MLIDRSALGTAVRTLAVPVLAYLAIATVLIAAPAVGCSAAGGPSFTDPADGSAARRLMCAVQFDGHEYLAIADRGYWYVMDEQSNVAWFPLYPMTVRALRGAVGDLTLAGVAVTFASGALAAVLAWRWLCTKLDGTRARALAFATFLLFPYGWYLYGIVYADAMLVALVIGAFLLVERRLLVVGGLVGALATACRPTGFALVLPLLVLGLVREGVLVRDPFARGWRARVAMPIRDRSVPLRWRHLGPALSLAGIAGFAAFQWWRFGTPLAFLDSQAAFHPDVPPLTKPVFVARVLHPVDGVVTTTLVIQALLALGALALVPAICRRFGVAYGLFVGLLAAIPTVTSPDWMGTGRYLMPALPVAAIIGERMAARWPARVWPVAAWPVALALALIALATLFAKGYYLA